MTNISGDKSSAFGFTGYKVDPSNNLLLALYRVYDARTTEQIDDVPLKASYNNMNRITTQDPGGLLRFAGTVSEAATVSVAGKPAVVSATNTFSGTTTVSAGTNTIQVQATDYSNNTRTNTYSVPVSGTSKVFAHDGNGNQTSDGTRTFEWDAENRLLAINNGTLRSEFTYDGLNRRVRIVEKNSGAVTSDLRFLWCEEQLCEERDSSGVTINKRFFAKGFRESGIDYFYATDHLGSVREVTDATATLASRYDYDPYGKQSQSMGATKNADFGFNGHNVHASSGLTLTPYRAYSGSAGRFLSEDPIGLVAGADFYVYVQNNPVGRIDPLGLIHQAWGEPPFDGRLHDDPSGGLEVLCRNNRNSKHDIVMLEHSIAVRTAEIVHFGDQADPNHIQRPENEIDTLARCKKCEDEKPEPEKVPFEVPKDVVGEESHAGFDNWRPNRDRRRNSLSAIYRWWESCCLTGRAMKILAYVRHFTIPRGKCWRSV